jgi:MFS family permease
MAVSDAQKPRRAALRARLIPVTLYALAFFIPTIVQGLGYRGISTQLHSVPPYACSAVFAIASCYFSDSFRHRGLFVIVSALISIVGYALFLASTDNQVLYGSVFLQVIGAYTMAPLLSSWMPNNLAPYYKRVTGIAFGFISTNSGGILSTWLFPTTDAPRYRTATWTTLGFSISIVVLAAMNSVFLTRENRRKARQESDRDEGDKDPSFKYIT